MLALILLVPIVALTFLLWLEGQRFEAAEKRWAEERDKLCQRIQAPERAMIEDFEPTDPVQYVPFDDDYAFQRNREELGGG